MKQEVATPRDLITFREWFLYVFMNLNVLCVSEVMNDIP